MAATTRLTAMGISGAAVTISPALAVGIFIVEATEVFVAGAVASEVFVAGAVEAEVSG